MATSPQKKYSLYLNELRTIIIRVLVVFVVGILFGFIFSNKILIFCLKLFNFSGVNIVMTSPAQLINLSIYTGILSGFLFALPFFISQLILFARPAFTKQEYGLVKLFLPLSLILFLIGTFFGAWITQFIISMFSRFSGEFQLNNLWDIQKFFSQIVMTAILMGLIFQMPLVLTALIRTGLVSRLFFIKNRPYVYTVLLIITILLPPTDIISLLLLIAPILFLFEFTLLLNINQT